MPILPPRPQIDEKGPQAKALHDFDGNLDKGELPLFEDEIVYLICRVNEDWMAGSLSSGEN
eukprot:Awhi_evm1s10505